MEEYANLITETKAAFNPAINYVESDVLKSYLDQDAFVFSGLKAHRQLTQARSLLKDAKGNIRPYHQFEQEIIKLNNTYNKVYLEAEYEFAVHSAQSADQWSNLSDDTERYWLQYRTAQDERVREDHAALHGTTLPKDDPFWDSYYPPNGWRCRCVAVEVLARKNKLSDSKEAIKKGEASTTAIGKNGKNKLEMFRFNPGKQQKLFPPKNSYMPRGCGGTLSITDAVFLALDDEACRAYKSILDESEKVFRKSEYDRLKNNKNYFDVKYNDGALKATHKYHHFDKKTGRYEVHVREALYKNGHYVTLEDERSNIGKVPDGFLNKMSFEISTITGIGDNAVKRALNHCRGKNADIAVIYFSDESLFNTKRLLNGIARYQGQSKYKFKEIVYVVGDGVYTYK